MKHFVPLRIRVEKDIIVRINRILQGNGTFMVAQNQEVSPADIIGVSTVSSGFRILNLAAMLAVSPQDVEKYLKRAVGQRIYKGELLAYKDGGLFGGKKTVVSPTDGALDYLNPETGEIKMTLLPRKLNLPAGVYGVVEEIDKEKGKVVIRTQTTRIQGMCGSGKLRDGILEFICKRDNLVSGRTISTKSEGHILVGGSLVYKDAISAAISDGINGIITGGINAKDYKSMAGGRLIFPKKIENDIGLSVIVCEGFGSVPIGSDIYEELLKYDGRFVSIDGNKGIIDLPSFSSSSLDRVRATRLPLVQDDFTTYDERISKVVELKTGLDVRIIGNSFPGEEGRVIALDESLSRLPSGINAYLVTVETKRRKIKVPVVNLEVIDYIG